MTMESLALRGRVITPADEIYRDARRLFNGMIDERPTPIARRVDAADVMT